MSGVTPEGFEAKTTEDLVAELEAALRTQLGASIDLSASSVLGQLVGIFADRYAELWEAAEVIANATNPDTATGAALEALCALTGVIPEPAAPSSAVVTLAGDAATVIPEDSEVSVETTEVRFAPQAELTLAAATAWASTTAYAAQDVRKNGANVYVCVIGGVSAGSGGPTGTGTAIVDGTVTWAFVGVGAAFAQSTWLAVENGPLPALSTTLSVIETPISGWTGVRNALDAELGALKESDVELRLRREEELRGAAFGALEAIRTHVLRVADVVAVTVFENVTDATDGDGLPPHSVEVMVQGGVDQDVFQAVFESVAAGIATHGTESGTVEDSQGISHTIKFTRPDEIEIYVTLNVDVDANTYPADGDAQLEALIGGIVYPAGRDVRSTAVGARAFEVSGVLGAVALIDDAPAPAGTATIPITLREIAAFDSSRVVVNSTPVTP